jgi:hypothetical protein
MRYTKAPWFLQLMYIDRMTPVLLLDYTIQAEATAVKKWVVWNNVQEYVGE